MARITTPKRRVTNNATYYTSPQWAARKTEAIERAGFICEWPGCGSWDNLQVDHKNYDRFRDEAPDDLWVLCRRHHEQVTIDRAAARQPRCQDCACTEALVDGLRCRYCYEMDKMHWQELQDQRYRDSTRPRAA